MDALRPRSRYVFTPVLEWLIAASFLAATIAVGAMILRELGAAPQRVAPAVTPAPALAPPPAASISDGIPGKSVSVTVLPLRDGKELRIGDTLGAVARRLGRAAEVGRQEVGRGILGERLTRFYEHDGARFILVFEPLEPRGEAKVAAIYLQ